MGYWGFRGRGGFVRLTLAYLNIPFKEENPSLQDWKEKAKDFQKKGLPFPNLPYVIDKDFMCSESMVVPLYLCKREGRLDLIGGESWESRMRLKQLFGVIKDVNSAVSSKIGGKEYKKNFTESTKEGSVLRAKLKGLSEFLGKNNWLVDNTFSFADIVLAYTLYNLRMILRGAGVEDSIENFPNLVALRKRFFEQPGIKEHLKSESWTGKTQFYTLRFPWIKDDGSF